MAEKNPGVAEAPLPGTVLSPNAEGKNVFEEEHVDELAQFGQEQQKPNAAKPSIPLATDDQKRFEYWQGIADKEQKRANDLSAQLLAKSKMDPLIDVLQKDEVAFRFLQDRLNGNSAPSKPLEAPQKPNNFNEVEAFSNPESASFKYRIELDNFRDARLQQVEKQNAALLQAREQEKAMLEQQRTNQEGLLKFRNEVISKGIPEEKFREFYSLVNGAGVDDVVGYFKWKEAQASSTGIPRFDGSLTSSAGQPGRKVLNIGDSIVELSRNM